MTLGSSGPPGQAFPSVAARCEDQWLQRPEPGTGGAGDPLMILAKLDLRNSMKRNQQESTGRHVIQMSYKCHRTYYIILSASPASRTGGIYDEYFPIFPSSHLPIFPSSHLPTACQSENQYDPTRPSELVIAQPAPLWDPSRPAGHHLWEKGPAPTGITTHNIPQLP